MAAKNKSFRTDIITVKKRLKDIGKILYSWILIDVPAWAEKKVALAFVTAEDIADLLAQVPASNVGDRSWVFALL